MKLKDFSTKYGVNHSTATAGALRALIDITGTYPTSYNAVFTAEFEEEDIIKGTLDELEYQKQIMIEAWDECPECGKELKEKLDQNHNIYMQLFKALKEIQAETK